MKKPGDENLPSLNLGDISDCREHGYKTGI
jgi:hypothetical protein